MWPVEGRELWAELSRFRGRLALIVGDPGVADVLAQVAGTQLCSIGRRISQFEAPPAPGQVASALTGERVLIELDILFAPELGIDPVRLLRDQARAVGGVVALWPGEVQRARPLTARVASTDSVIPGRHTGSPVTPGGFPDETPYTVERIP